MKKLALYFLFVFLAISVAYASDVAYILVNPTQPDPALTSALSEIGMSYDIIDNEDIASYDLSLYKFMLMPDQVFMNNDLIPVNDVPSLIINHNHMDEWDWIQDGKISSKSSSQPLTAYITNSTHFITNGLSGTVTVYTSGVPILSYLHRFYRAPQIKSIVGTDNLNSLNTLNAVIGTAEPGTVLRNGVISNTKTVFFGLTSPQYWSAETEQMFKNSAKWLATDFVPPVVSNIQITALTNQSVTISWNTNKSANYTLSYGTDLNLSTKAVNKTLSMQHSLTLKNLKEKTAYYFKIEACNANAFCSNSTLQSFTTLDLTAPYLALAQANSITNTSVIIAAQVTEAAAIKLHYGTAQLDQITLASAIAMSANFSLSNLQDKTTYSYKAEMCDAAGNCRNSSIFSFTTLDISAPKAPQNLKIAVEQPGNKIKLSWDQATDDTSKHLIYASNSPNGFNFSAPIGNSDSPSVNEFVDASAGSLGERFYVVRSQDGHGNTETNTVVVGKFDLNLKKGFNLVSFPLSPQDTTISKVMHQNSTYSIVSQVKAFDASSQQFIDSSFNGNTWNNTIALQQGSGYFFNAGNDAIFTIVGYPSDPIQLQMQEGMNLFGLVSLSQKQLSAVITQTPASLNVSEVGKRNSDGSYSLSSYTNAWSDDLNLTPGFGYWAKANTDFTLMVNP